MAIKKILLMGDSRLRQKSLEVDESKIKTKEIKNLIQDLKDTAKLNPEGEGFITVGLSAPQINQQLRIFVVIKNIEHKGEPEFQVFINPIMDIETTNMVSGNESCLSTPGLCGIVSRYDSIKLQYIDENGKKQKEKLSGEKAVFVQHEIDHLDGILWIDKVKDTKTISYC